MGSNPRIDARSPGDARRSHGHCHGTDLTAAYNDFITRDGFQVGAAYKAPGGADVDTMLLVYRVTLPGYAGH